MLPRLTFPFDDGCAVPVPIAIMRLAYRYTGAHRPHADANSSLLRIRRRDGKADARYGRQ
jgi:hypothetical protein